MTWFLSTPSVHLCSCGSWWKFSGRWSNGWFRICVLRGKWSGGSMECHSVMHVVLDHCNFSNGFPMESCMKSWGICIWLSIPLFHKLHRPLVKCQPITREPYGVFWSISPCISLNWYINISINTEPISMILNVLYSYQQDLSNYIYITPLIEELGEWK